MLEPGVLLDNKYRIEAAIGRGGFGHVYRAKDQLTGEQIAIKELVPQLAGDPQMVQRFIQEARATLRLTHANIVRSRNVFRDGGMYYLSMAYLPGGSLSDRLRRGSLSQDEALGILHDLCAALEYAHSQGVVHCDLKPANVLFDEEGTAYVADFGIAHVSEELMTRMVHTGTGMVLGTVRYMAPEQLEGVRDDPRVDVYALGALLYEMLAGRPYLDFETETTPAAQARNIARIQQEAPRALASVSPSTADWLAEVTDQALRKAPEERHATVDALREALRSPDAGIDSHLVLALPDGRKVDLDEGTITLGRDSHCDVVLSDKRVSRRHAAVQVAERRAEVTDLGSRNGTLINGRRAKPHSPQRLQAGDQLQLGPKVVLQVERQARPVPRPEPPPQEPPIHHPPAPTEMHEPPKPRPKREQDARRTRRSPQSRSCCLTSLLLLLLPRLLLIGWWLVEPVRVSYGIGENWIVALVSWLLMPWLTLAYLLIFPGGIAGADWILLGLGLLADAAGYLSGIISRR